LDINPTFGVFFMTKYDQAFRQKLVEEYLASGLGFTSLSSKYGISRSVLRSWVSRYSHHGQSALSKKQGHYSAEFKRSVLTTMWQQELSYREACALFDLRGGANVVSVWERSYHEGGLDALKPKPRGRPKKMETHCIA
jgi:transposase